MALIELRNATIRIVDGFTATAQINQPSVAPLNSDTTLEIDGLTAGIDITPGTRFTIEGVTYQYYYVTARNNDDTQLITVDATSGDFTLGFEGTTANPIATETTAGIPEGSTASAVQAALEALSSIDPGDVVVSGSADGPWTVQFTGQYAGVEMEPLIVTDDSLNTPITVTQADINVGGTTRQITFTPALATANGIPADDDDVSFVGHSVVIKVGEGNLTYTENKDYEYVLDRGNLSEVKENDQVPLDLVFDFVWEELTATGSSLIPTIEDALKHRGPASDWISSSADPCQPYAVDIEVEHVPPCGGAEREFVLFPDYRYDTLDHDLDGATVASTGRCNVTEPTISRVAQ